MRWLRRRWRARRGGLNPSVDVSGFLFGPVHALSQLGWASSGADADGFRIDVRGCPGGGLVGWTGNRTPPDASVRCRGAGGRGRAFVWCCADVGGEWAGTAGCGRRAGDQLGGLVAWLGRTFIDDDQDPTIGFGALSTLASVAVGGDTASQTVVSSDAGTTMKPIRGGRFAPGKHGVVVGGHGSSPLMWPTASCVAVRDRELNIGRGRQEELSRGDAARRRPDAGHRGATGRARMPRRRS